LINGYQSHYVITTKGGMALTRTDHEQQISNYDELVIGQESQVVPLFLLQIGEESIAKIYKEWERDVPLS